MPRLESGRVIICSQKVVKVSPSLKKQSSKDQSEATWKVVERGTLFAHRENERC
jgi:hypothetical protein